MPLIVLGDTACVLVEKNEIAGGGVVVRAGSAGAAERGGGGGCETMGTRLRGRVSGAYGGAVVEIGFALGMDWTFARFGGRAWRLSLDCLSFGIPPANKLSNWGGPSQLPLEGFRFGTPPENRSPSSGGPFDRPSAP